MSFWKKVAGLLFEESDSVVADDELEDISFPEETIVQKKTIVKQKEEPVISTFDTVDFEEDVEPIVKQQPQPQENVKKFVSIEITDEKVEKVKEKEKEIKTRTPISSITREEKKDFEFSPVITPIFGSKDETVVEKGKTSMITLPKKKHDNPLGTVISPYFGLGELEEFKVEAQETIEKKEKSLQEELPSEEIEQYVEEDDMNSISIDEILVENDTEEDVDDMMQISLFGEATPIRDSDEEVSK